MTHFHRAAPRRTHRVPGIRFCLSQSLIESRTPYRFFSPLSAAGIEFDDGIACNVCFALEGEDGNEMIFCDACDVCVHQACYGVQTIPDGDWLCRTCATGHFLLDCCVRRFIRPLVRVMLVTNVEIRGIMLSEFRTRRFLLSLF